MRTIVSIDKLCKTYSNGYQALKNVSLDIYEGEILALLGPNGAGKTTVFNMLTGYLKPTSGKILFDGEEITGFKAHRITHKGIARTFQNIRLFKGMSVLENVMVGFHHRARVNFVKAALRFPSFWQEEEEFYLVRSSSDSITMSLAPPTSLTTPFTPTRR